LIILDKIKKLTGILPEKNILFNEPMAKHTTFKTGGAADAIALPESEEEIINCLKFAKEEGIPYYVIGNGSNLLVSDKGIRGIVIKIFKNFSKIDVDNNCITAQSGALLSKVASIAAKNSLTGMEFASGIPGCIGGGVFMNAGAYGGEMRDIVVESRYIDKDFNIKVLKEHNFSYRHSIYQELDAVIVGVKLELKKGSSEEIYAEMARLSEARISKQPTDMPSAGSAFKRPEGHFAAKLIDDCGLRGYSIGGAQVSEKHTGFVVNKGGAMSSDIKKLMENVKEIVFDKTGVLLQPEIKFIGED